MTFQDLLIFAAKKEQQAVELYTSMKAAVDSDELKKMFDFLVEQEKEHKLKLETEYEKHVLEEGQKKSLNIFYGVTNGKMGMHCLWLCL